MNKGDRFVVELELETKSMMLNPNVSYFNLVGTDDRAALLDAEVERAAAAYAAKSAPAPVSTAWEPKVGERVLVEAEVGSEPDAQGDYSVLFDYHTRSNTPAVWDAVVSRSAIVGPAPKRARFEVGQEVFSAYHLDRVEIDREDADGWWYVKDDTGDINRVNERDLFTPDEARERLAK